MPSYEPTPGILSYDEFLEYAEAHEGRFEYVDSRAVAMDYPGDAHQDLAGELAFALQGHVGEGCKVRIAGRLETKGIYGMNMRVPDLMLICPDGKPGKLVCEILSPTRDDDLGIKLTEYRAMPEFDEYLVVDSTQRWVRLFHRTADGNFTFDVDHIDGLVYLKSIDFTLDIDDLYANAGVA